MPDSKPHPVFEHHAGVPRPFAVDVDHVNEIIRIQGVNYAFAFFDAMAHGSEGARFEIGKRSDGVVTLYTLPKESE